MKKVWLITGVTSGFGYEMTKQLLENGDTVIGTVRNTEKVQDFMKKYPDTFDCKILDVTDLKAVEQTVHDSFKKQSGCRCQQCRIWLVWLRRRTE